MKSGWLRDVLLVVLVLYAVTMREPAQATYKSIQILKTPSALLHLAANTVTVVPGAYCSVIIRNHNANPVFWGGPKIGNVVTAGITVNTTGGLAICTDTAACSSELFSGNVMSGGIALLSTIDTDVRYTVGEGCQP